MQVLSKVVIVLSVLFGGVVVATPNIAFAAATGECTHIVGKNGNWFPKDTAMTATETGGDTKAPPSCGEAAGTMIGKILRFVKIISALVVAFAVGMIIYSGFKYITSQGDPKAIEGAKQQLWYSGVGLFIVLTAFTILKLFETASGGI